jgi:hypothetical protein
LKIELKKDWLLIKKGVFMQVQTSIEYPTFILAQLEQKMRLVEYPGPEIPAIGSTPIEELVKHVSNKQKTKYNIDALLPPNNSAFAFRLKTKHIKVMGKLANIEYNTWNQIITVGREFLKITNRNWYQTNDSSFSQSHSISRIFSEIISKLKTDNDIKDKCNAFVENCPSPWYRAIVRLALNGCHWNSGEMGKDYEGHQFPSKTKLLKAV